MRTPRRKEKRGGGKREDGYRCGQRQRIKLRLWMGAGRGQGVFVRARMIRRMQQPSKAKVQKSLKNPRGSLREHSGLAKGSAGAQLLVSRRRPSELSCAVRPLLCVGLWLCGGDSP